MTPRTQNDTLECFFAAARAEDRPPPTALVSAILADAAEVQAAHATVAASRRPAPSPYRRLRRAFEPLGGLGGLAALGACAALGFWLGVAGTLSLDDATLTAGTETAADEVDAFFDYASLEE